MHLDVLALVEGCHHVGLMLAPVPLLDACIHGREYLLRLIHVRDQADDRPEPGRVGRLMEKVNRHIRCVSISLHWHGGLIEALQRRLRERNMLVVDSLQPLKRPLAL